MQNPATETPCLTILGTNKLICFFSDGTKVEEDVRIYFAFQNYLKISPFNQTTGAPLPPVQPIFL